MDKVTSSIASSIDEMPIALSDSTENFLMDYGGKARRITISGVLLEGTALGTGTGMTVTALEDQVSAIESKFINLDTTSNTYHLEIYAPGASSASQTYEIVASNLRITRNNPVEYSFELELVEGSPV